MKNLFRYVENNYSHQPKKLLPGTALQNENVYLKWYLIHPESLPISTGEMLDAQTFLLEEIRAAQLELVNEVGFVIQHRTPEWLILYVCSWRGNNEVWETLYHNRLASTEGYKRLQRQDTSPTFCVWVLSAVAHEQRAWSRFLESARDEQAQMMYLNDQLTGLVR